MLLRATLIAAAMKRAAVAVLVGVALFGAPVANADPDPVSDSEQATCEVLSENLNGNADHDFHSLTVISDAISMNYKVSQDRALKIELEQVKAYCPSLWPYVENAAENGHP
jgi:hypothetical protein